MTRRDERRGGSLPEGRAKVPNAGVCSVPGCGRRVRARGLCLTHYQQMKRHGKTSPIKPRRPARPNTVRLGGRQLTAEAADVLKREMARRGVTFHALAVDILEGWARCTLRKKR